MPATIWSWKLPSAYIRFVFTHLNPETIQHRDQPTCAYALLALPKEDILRLCQYVVHPYGATSMVYNIAPGQLILQFISKYTLQTNQQLAITHSGCSLCMLTIPCNTLFTALQYRYYAQVSHCNASPQLHSGLEFSVNIALLERHFNTSDLTDSDHQLMTSLPLISLPNLAFHLAKTARQIGLLQTNLLDLDNVTQSALISSDISLSLADRLKCYWNNSNSTHNGRSASAGHT